LEKFTYPFYVSVSSDSTIVDGFLKGKEDEVKKIFSGTLKFPCPFAEKMPDYATSSVVIFRKRAGESEIES